MKIILASSSTTMEENKEILSSSKFELILFPTIEFKPIRKKPVNLKGYEWLVISSRKAYDFLSPLVKPEELQKIKIAAVGEATAGYLQEKNIKINFVSSTFTGEDFAREFGEKFHAMKGKILRPVSSLAPRGLERILKKFGIEVDTLPLYKPVCPLYSEEEIKKIKEENFKGIIFASPSTWYNFKRIFDPDYPQFLNGKIIGVIGPTTGKALEKDGYKKYIIPEKYTLAHLIKKLEGELL